MMNSLHNFHWIMAGAALLFYGCGVKDTPASAFAKVIPTAHSMGFTPVGYVQDYIGRDTVIVFQVSFQPTIDPTALGWIVMDEGDKIASEVGHRLGTPVPKGGKAFLGQWNRYVCRLYIPPASETGYILVFDH